MPPRIAVIGAGPAGLAAAVRLIDAGAECVVFEAGRDVGGLARTVDLDGIAADAGPHVFAGGPSEATTMWRRFLGASHPVPLRRGILRGESLLDHPPRPFDLLRTLSAAELLACASGVLRGRLSRNARGGDTESWIVSRYGRGLYDLVARPYVEKLWGRPGSAIDEGFAHALFREADRVTARPAPAPLATFDFPVGGSSAVWARMAEMIRDAGELRLESPVDRIAGDADGYVVRSPSSADRFDGVVSTLPPRRLAAALDAPADVRDAAGGLVTRHVLLVQMRVDEGRPLDRAWIFVADRSFAVGRITDSRTWNGQAARGVVSMEFWCDDDDAIWNATDDTIIGQARAELDRLALLAGSRVGPGRVVRLRGALPVPAIDAPQRMAVIRRFTDSRRGIFSIGRHGSFSFNSMAESMAEGIGAADRALAL